MERRILLTGASGYIGSNLLPLLAAKSQVVVLGRHLTAGPRSLRQERFDIIGQKITAKFFQKLGCDTLVHLAWQLPHEDYWNSPLNLVWLKQSAALIRAFVEAGGRHVHVAGTCAEYDWSSAMPLGEDTSLISPRGLYGKCKNALRHMARRACQEYGATLGWYRIFWLYGSNQDKRKFIPSVVEALRRGEDITCKHAQLRRDYIHIHDAAALLAMGIEKDCNEAVNIGSGKAIALGEIATQIAAAMGRRGRLRLASAVCADAETVVADTRKQRTLLNFTPAVRMDRALPHLIGIGAPGGSNNGDLQILRQSAT